MKQKHWYDSFWLVWLVSVTVVLSIYGAVFIYITSAESKTIVGTITSIEVLPIQDRYLISFSDGTSLVIDDGALTNIDGYEGRMQITFHRCLYHDSNYWTVFRMVKLDSWVKQ